MNSRAVIASSEAQDRASYPPKLAHSKGRVSVRHKSLSGWTIIRFGPKADICSAKAHVRFGPKANIKWTNKKGRWMKRP